MVLARLQFLKYRIGNRASAIRGYDNHFRFTLGQFILNLKPDRVASKTLVAVALGNADPPGLFEGERQRFTFAYNSPILEVKFLLKKMKHSQSSHNLRKQMPFALHVAANEHRIARRCPPASLPAKRQFFRMIAIPLLSRSAGNPPFGDILKIWRFQLKSFVFTANHEEMNSFSFM